MQLGESRWPPIVLDARARGERKRGVTDLSYLTGHSQVETGPGTAVELEPEMFAPPAGVEHGATTQGPRESGGADPVKDNGVTCRVNPHDASVTRRPLEEAPRTFDLGKLRHREAN